MGAWGTGIYDDDLALGLKDEYEQLKENMLTDEEVINRLVSEHEDILADNVDGSVFWITLASTQLEVGSLTERVRQQALEVIDKGLGLEQWKDDPDLLNERKQVLLDFRERIINY